MKVTQIFVTAVMFVFANPMLFAQSQCAQVSGYGVSCKADGCSQNVTIMIPQSSAYGSLYGAGYVSCCGSNIVSYYPAGGQCLIARLKEPEVFRRLVNVSSSQTVLVANCKGQYEPFVQPKIAGRPGKSVAPTALGEKIVWSGQ